MRMYPPIEPSIPGVRVYSADRAASAFSRIFSSILPSLANLSWAFDAGSFNLNLAEDGPRRGFEALLGPPAIDDLYWVKVPGFIGNYAGFVRDDWNALYGFAPGEDVNQLRELYSQDRLVERVQMLFDNYDGCYWACYAREAGLLEILVRDLSSRAGFKLVRTTLEETQHMHQAESERHRI